MNLPTKHTGVQKMDAANSEIKKIKFWVETIELLMSKGMNRQDAEDQLLIFLQDFKEVAYKNVK